MKKIFFFATMLLSIAATAQQRTFVKSVGANYAAKQVTFNISWAAGSRGTVGTNTYNSKVWVLVDYQEVQNGVTVGSWKRANVVLTSLPAGCTADGTNTKGFWYQGQTSAAQNASITVTLSGVPPQFNWCAFASDCPPRVIASSNGSYTFAGTPPFVLTAANGATQQVNGNTLAHSALTISPYRLSDQTNCPGIFCPYTGSDLYIDATHICQLRTGDAKNWEAWIKDARDSKTYRIAQLSTGLWTMDDYLNYKGHPAVVTELCSNTDPNGTEYWRYLIYDNSNTPLCPAGWRLPTQSEYELTVNAWAQYLSKVYKNTGETIYSSYRYFCQNGGYISFIVSTCLQLSSWGGRTSSINPVTLPAAIYGNQTCGSWTGYTNGNQHSRYSGYARCVK